ncbi:MAG TPA: response regulator [Kofleriaceae bacterium]
MSFPYVVTMAKHDDNERRVAELERALRMRDELLAVLAHDLRAPLHAILGWSEILLARAGGPPVLAAPAAGPKLPGAAPLPADPRAGLEAIARNARAQAQLIEDAVDLNRLFSGKQRLEVQPLDVSAVVAAAVDAVQPAALAKELTIAPVLDADAQCAADPQRLLQIVTRLLREAIKLSPARSQIGIAGRRADGQLELTISSTGPGAQSASGSVAIARTLAELQDGSVRLEGNRITLRLPSGDAAPVRPPALEPRRTPAPLRPLVALDGVKVLVIDDDSDARDMVQAILLDARANAFTAASADEGLTLLRDFKPDVIISDIGMSARDGYQFIRLVRMMPTAEGGRTPALALTAHVQTEDRTRALLAGYQEHIPKPVEAHQLLTAVHRLLEPAPAQD